MFCVSRRRLLNSSRSKLNNLLLLFYVRLLTEVSYILESISSPDIQRVNASVHVYLRLCTRETEYNHLYVHSSLPFNAKDDSSRSCLKLPWVFWLPIFEIKSRWNAVTSGQLPNSTNRIILSPLKQHKFLIATTTYKTQRVKGNHVRTHLHTEVGRHIYVPT